MNYDNFFKGMVDNLFDGVYFVDPSRKITYWNQAAGRLTGYDAAEIVGKYCMHDILEDVDAEGNHLCVSGCPLAKTLCDGKPHTAEMFLRHKDGHRVPVAVRVAPVMDGDGTITGAVMIFNDNTPAEAAREKMRELEDLAFLDALTGLANRRCIERQLTTRLDEMRRYGWQLGLLFADIDHFK